MFIVFVFFVLMIIIIILLKKEAKPGSFAEKHSAKLGPTRMDAQFKDTAILRAECKLCQDLVHQRDRIPPSLQGYAPHDTQSAVITSAGQVK